MVDNGYSLRIDYNADSGDIALEALRPERFTHYGFGTFLENVDPKEVSISRVALDALLECPERSGLQGLEFWPDNRLAWGDSSPRFLVPTDAINCPKNAKDWIKEFDVQD